jgi:hypothetical protein
MARKGGSVVAKRLPTVRVGGREAVWLPPLDVDAPSPPSSTGRPRVERLGWTTLTQLALMARSKGLKLAVIVQEVPGTFGEWGVAAIETPGTTVQSVFDAHAHKDLGTFRGLALAMEASERYAKKWQRSRAKMREPCTCDEVKP